MAEMTEKEILINKQNRARIMRLTAMFYPTPTSIKQVRNSLMEYGSVLSQAEVSKYLYYLRDKGYIKYSDSTGKSEDSELIYITADGIDLVEGTITDDGLYM